MLCKNVQCCCNNLENSCFVEALGLSYLIEDDVELLVSTNMDTTPELGVLQVSL